MNGKIPPITITLGNFRKMVSVAKTENDRAILNLYLSGVLGAYGWANATLAVRHQPLLFCAPARPSLVPGPSSERV